MTTLAAPTVLAEPSDRIEAALRRARAALWLGAAAAVALAAIVLFVTTTSDEGPFHHAGDYALTATGIPCMLALVTLLPALRTLQHGRDGRLGKAGIAIATAAAAVLTGIFVYGLAAATASSLGPTYVLASLGTILGVGLCAAGCWRTRLLPRWLVVLWVVAWVGGSMLPIAKAGPFLLAVVYAAMALLLPQRIARAGSPS